MDQKTSPHSEKKAANVTRLPSEEKGDKELSKQGQGPQQNLASGSRNGTKPNQGRQRPAGSKESHGIL